MTFLAASLAGLSTPLASASSRYASASSAETFSAGEISLIRLTRARSYIVRSAADSEASRLRAARFRTTSATWYTSPLFSFSWWFLNRRLQFDGTRGIGLRQHGDQVLQLVGGHRRAHPDLLGHVDGHLERHLVDDGLQDEVLALLAERLHLLRPHHDAGTVLRIDDGVTLLELHARLSIGRTSGIAAILKAKAIHSQLRPWPIVSAAGPRLDPWPPASAGGTVRQGLNSEGAGARADHHCRDVGGIDPRRATEARLHDRRIVALPPPEPDQAPGRVDGWIDHHLRQLLAADVSPPYHLVGWSFGGVIELELARHLRTEGTAIAYVALLDSIRPWLRPLRWRDACLPPDRSCAHSQPGRPPGVPHRSGQDDGPPPTSPNTGPAKVFPSLRQRATGPKRAKPTDPLVRSIHKSYLNYAAAPVDFPVSLFVTGASVERCDGDVSLRWAPFLRAGYQAIPVAGDHEGMWDERPADTLGAALERDLERASRERDAAARLGRCGQVPRPPVRPRS